MAAVCHHGGAGTTAAGLRAGKPTIIVPFFGDQFFWGSMVSKSGAGPPPIPGKRINVNDLVEAFKFVHEPATRAAAQELGVALQKENGCEAAVQSFHANLPLNEMRSSLEPSFCARFRLNNYCLQISRPVAQVLVAAGAIDESELSVHHIFNWKTSTRTTSFERSRQRNKKTESRPSGIFDSPKRSKSACLTERKPSRAALNLPKYDAVTIEYPFKESLVLYGKIKEQPEEELDESLVSPKKAKHNVHYANSVATVFTEKSSFQHSRHSISSIRSSSTNSLPHKNVSKLRFADIVLPALYNKNSHTQIKNRPSTQKKYPGLFASKVKIILAANAKNASKPPEEKAADKSGLTVSECKKILDEFKQIKHDRYYSNNNDKSIHRIRASTSHSLHRSISRTSVSN